MTYQLWSACLAHDNSAALQIANKYGAMLAEPKLRVLARMGVLPSWWFLREQVVLIVMKRMGKAVDDEVMHVWFGEATRQTGSIMEKVERERARGEKEKGWDGVLGRKESRKN